MKYLTLLLIFFTFGSFSTQEPSIEKAPNFLFISVDDLNIYTSTLGETEGNFLKMIYPDERVRKSILSRLSPNIQKFAKNAVTFDHAYCAFPLCGPSRTALLTGIPPHVSGYTEHKKHFRHYPRLTKAVTLPQYLKEKGYYTSGIGKVFHKSKAYLDRGVFSDWPDRLFSWSSWVDRNIGIGKAPEIDFQVKELPSRYWNKDAYSKKSFTRFGTYNLPIEYSNDYQNAKHISTLLTEGESRLKDVHGTLHSVKLPREKPFFLACGLFAPHLPWMVGQEFYDLFPKEEMAINQDLITWVQEDLEDLSPAGKKFCEQSNFQDLLDYAKELEPEMGEVDAWKTIFQAYLATIAFSDRNLGLLFDAAEGSPMKENTIVILWSDHGYHLGDKNREGKTSLWEASNRCNLMIYNPKQKNKHVKFKKVTSPVSLQDLYPTIVSLAGLKRPAQIYGNDLTPLLEDPNMEWAEPILNTNGTNSHALIHKGYRYIRFANGDEEFYDLSMDPFELQNLAADSLKPVEMDQMRHLLKKTLAKGPKP